MELTITERLALFDILPATGDFTTLKLLREFKESLTPSKIDEDSGIRFSHEYKCPKCEVIDVFPLPVKCGKCDEWMKPTGKMGCSDWNFTRDMPISDEIQEIIVVNLKQMNDKKKLKETHMTLYEKFVGGQDANKESV